ncbi:glycine-rich protein [Paraliomyxa miuraensis]|uniref:glycine-rich protein n=1 Tax=Paraliomyxa miuraensis TaxID=376150 RepID=UPI0022513948|nr:glycine-rich protein [Paraliomyxa miuraensis]MCX4242596.1 glycine-rich protein [Paraliomyxa miuraensis]
MTARRREALVSAPLGLLLCTALAGCFAPPDVPLETETFSTFSPPTTEDGTTAVDGTISVDGTTVVGETSADSTSGSELCGNGEVDEGEECDLAANNSDNAGCTSDCRLATCGDGLLYVGREECDDGNTDDTDECPSTCVEATCGDGFVWAGTEQCDGDIANGACNACTIACDEGFDDCDGDGASCEVELCGGTCDQPGPLPGPIEFMVSGVVDTFVVPPCVTLVTIEAWGAQGGDNISLVDLGGRGARMRGDFMVAPGDELSIVVGQRGTNATSGNAANGAGGGGGGSFVWRTAGQELLIAAGGGGGSSLTNNGMPHYLGKDGVVEQNGTGSRSHDQYGDAPGGMNGGNGKTVCGAGGNGWASVLANPAGQTACNYGGNGGFGGGGGSGCAPNICNDLHTAGGGGGYSGGGAGGSCYYYGGGGGGSFNMGANPDNSPGVRMGDGLVTIAW